MKKTISSSKEYHLGNHTNPKECHFRKVNGRKMWAAGEGGKILFWPDEQPFKPVCGGWYQKCLFLWWKIWCQSTCQFDLGHYSHLFTKEEWSNFYGKFAEKALPFVKDVEKEEKSHNRFLLVERCSRKSNFVSSNWRLGLEIHSSVKP